MIISLDYDDTYTADPEGWDAFCTLFMTRGHTVICVSARHPDHMQEVKDSLGKVIGENNCVGVNKQPKREYMLQQFGILIDVWIDDIPEAIVNVTLLNGL